MCDVEIPPELVEDPQGKTQPTRKRDIERTPMQWNPGPNAGFTTGTPFFPVAQDYRQVNVESQERNPRSLLAVYRRLIALRKAESSLTDGLQSPIGRRSSLLFYRRELPNRKLLVVLNMAADEVRFDFRELAMKARLLLSTFLDKEGESLEQEVQLRGNEGLVLALE